MNDSRKFTLQLLRWRNSPGGGWIDPATDESVRNWDAVLRRASKDAGVLAPNDALRDYQLSAINKTREAVAGGKRSVVIVLPTGAGKTKTGVGLILSVVSKGRKALWVVHRRELAAQASERMTRDGLPEHGVILEGKQSTRPHASVQIASVWTLESQGITPPADLIVWDEGHHATAETWRAIAAKYPQAIHVFLTATPQRADGTALGNVAQAIVSTITTSELIRRGILVPFDVLAPSKRLDKLAKDPVEVIAKYCRDRKTILFASDVNTSKDCVNRLNQAGILSAHIDGTTKPDLRDDILNSFRDGALQVLSNVGILTEGFDDPAISAVIIARGCTSIGNFLQCVGRASRCHPSKTRALLIDLRGCVHEHGLPDDDRVYSLEGEPIKTSAAIPTLTTCMECGATFRTAKTCPRCGSSIAEKTPAKSLANVDIKKVVKVVPLEQKQRTWENLCRRAAQLGRQPGWAAHIFNWNFGHFPDRRNYKNFYDIVKKSTKSVAS